MIRPPRASAAFAAALLGLCPGRFANASIDAGASDAGVAVSVRIASVEIHGEGNETVLRDSIRELLSRLDVDLGTPTEGEDAGGSVDAGEASEPFVRVDIDLTALGGATLVVRDTSGAVLARRFLPRDTTDAILREDLAHAVQAAVESEILQQQDRSAAASKPMPTAPAEAPALEASSQRARAVTFAPAGTRVPSRLGLDLSTAAGIGGFASETGPVTRVSLGAAVTWASPMRPALEASAQYILPFDSNNPGLLVVAHTSLVDVRVLPSLVPVRGRAFALEVGAGGGVDLLTVEPRVDGAPGHYVEPSTTRVDPMMSVAVTLHVAMPSGATATFAAVGDLDLALRDYVSLTGSTQTTVLVPWRVRPAFVAGFSFTAFGRGIFARGDRGR